MEADIAVFQACADATRLRILFLLRTRELCVCELVEVLQMPQGKISRHLGVLKQAGLVQSRREGTWIYYALKKASTGLTRRLVDYLKKEAGHDPLLARDLASLQKLAKAGALCGPRPAPRAART
ncbi:MAG: winged helix-turn-helix transcriptional regulator [Candidatus Latescibacteria bacterium]|nr:winged helix-turn-helix transcriptional regulator [Candidatus Latescibacterota bacterium]